MKTTIKQNGFTLIEMIMVLGIISMLILLAAPIQTSVLKTQIENKFIDTFKDDVLFIQNQASGYERGTLYIHFYSDHYIVTTGVRDAGHYAKRYYPEGWTNINASQARIQFKESGTIIRPRTVVMYSENERIHFTFPLGKGRFHVGREKRVHTN
ncbi:competence type IV pilus minor pilin ComGD [Oceanobacillus sp. CAU 1775]